MKTRLKKGQTVKIYEDPITESKLEGIATLCEPFIVDEYEDLEMWEVRFVDEEEQYLRTIKVKEGA